MTMFKLIILASIFIFMAGAIFIVYFRKHKLLFILATLIATISIYFLFKSIYTDIVDEVEMKTLNKSEKISKSIEEHPLLEASFPPSQYYVIPTIEKEENSILRLTKLSEKPSQFNSDEDWFTRNNLASLTYIVPKPFRDVGNNLPSFIPKKFKNSIIVKAIRGNPIIAIYGKDFSQGRYLLAIDPSTGKKLFSFDFNLYEWPSSFKQEDKPFVSMATVWAYIEENTLYVSHSHQTYASSSFGNNAYITAIDISSNTILWRSKPLVSNSSNFIVKNDAIITGYGFTKEKDYLYVLNKSDGRAVQKIQIKSGPSYLVEKDKQLYVNTYNTDYIFKYEDK